MAKKMPRKNADTMYIPTFRLSPPTQTLTIAAALARTSTPRRLHRSASRPEGISKTGTTTAYTAAITPTPAASKPMPVMKSFSTGTHSARFCRNAAAYSGASRRRSFRRAAPPSGAGVREPLTRNRYPEPAAQPPAPRGSRARDAPKGRCPPARPFLGSVTICWSVRGLLRVREEAAMSELAKPKVEVPKGDAPTELTVRDLVVGDGAEVKPGMVVRVHYVGVTFESGKEFDASWDRGQPFKFALGSGKVIKGWDRGVRGMKVGGRREIIVPPRLGYGNQSPSPLIPAGSTLVFVVDLLDSYSGTAGWSNA